MHHTQNLFHKYPQLEQVQFVLIRFRTQCALLQSINMTYCTLHGVAKQCGHLRQRDAVHLVVTPPLC